MIKKNLLAIVKMDTSMWMNKYVKVIYLFDSSIKNAHPSASPAL
jgi:hypothetical protein